MKKFAALVLAMIMCISMIAFAEQEVALEETVVEAAAAVEEAVAAVEAVTEEAAVEEVVVEETAEVEAEEVVGEGVVAEEAAEEVHVHTWDYALHVCVETGEAHPCYDVEAKAYAHDFTDSETCLNCGAAQFCGVEGHEGHTIASCGVEGHFTCDALDHETVYGKGYDMEGHTKCLAEVEHNCESCGATYMCERSNSHVTCKKCGNAWCYKAEGNHTEAECGHRYCEVFGETSKHSRCAGCRKFLCNGKSHAKCGVVEVEETEEEEKEVVEELLPC